MTSDVSVLKHIVVLLPTLGPRRDGSGDINQSFIVAASTSTVSKTKTTKMLEVQVCKEQCDQATAGLLRETKHL